MTKPKITLNVSQKIIWTIYIFVLAVSLFNDDDNFVGYLVLGWVPFLITHLLWRNDKEK